MGNGTWVSGLGLTLAAADLFTTGLYGCEASADGSYHTAIVRRHMTVIGEAGEGGAGVGRQSFTTLRSALFCLSEREHARSIVKFCASSSSSSPLV